MANKTKLELYLDTIKAIKDIYEDEHTKNKIICYISRNTLKYNPELEKDIKKYLVFDCEFTTPLLKASGIITKKEKNENENSYSKKYYELHKEEIKKKSLDRYHNKKNKKDEIKDEIDDKDE